MSKGGPSKSPPQIDVHTYKTKTTNDRTCTSKNCLGCSDIHSEQRKRLRRNTCISHSCKSKSETNCNCLYQKENNVLVWSICACTVFIGLRPLVGCTVTINSCQWNKSCVHRLVKRNNDGRIRQNKAKFSPLTP